MSSMRYVFIALCALAAANALAFTAATAIPLPAADAWYFIDTFVRKAVDGQLQLADFFFQRAAGDHAQPLHRLVLLGHLHLADLDFRAEAIFGIALGVVTCSILAAMLVAGATDRRERFLAWLGVATLFAVGLSLNATNIYTWSLVSLGWIATTVAVSYWRFAARSLQPSFWLPGFALATLAVASVLDELAFPVFAAAAAAVLVCGGYRDRRRAIAFVALGAIGLGVGRWLIHQMASVQGAADATGGKLSDLLALLGGPGAWKIIVAPLADSLVHQEHLLAWAPSSVVAIQVAIALALAALHLCFWWRVFRGRGRPADTVVVVAVSIMLFFYAAIAGIALSRASEFGVGYFHQPRYTAVYQLNVIALILMFAAPAAQPRRPDEVAPAGWPRPMAAVLMVALILLQVPLSHAAWTHAKYVDQYSRGAAEALAALGRNPGVQPAPSCPPILTICAKPPAVRVRTLALMREHHLNVYSARFRHSYGLEGLQLSDAAAEPRAAALPAGCAVSILKRGPLRVQPGKPFNVQPNGQSAFWMTVATDTRAFVLEFEGEPVPTARQGGLVTWYYDERQIAAAQAGRPLRYELLCGGRPAGSFEVAVH